MAKKKRDIKKSILIRVRILYIAFFFVGVAIVSRIAYIQYGPQGEQLRQMAEKISYERASISANRGDILSRDGRTLATSIPEYELRIDFGAHGLNDSIFRSNVDSLAYYLSNFFADRSKASYRSMLVDAYAHKSKNRYKKIAPRRANHVEFKVLSEFPLLNRGPNSGGLIAVPTNKRIRPHGTLAARTIGMTNESGVKVGIEGAYDSLLRGTDGNVLMKKISGDFRIPEPNILNIEPIDGIDVVSTIDVELQDVAESALRKQLIAMNAQWGTAVLMEVSTGEIRAITNLTRYNDQNVVEDYNYAIGTNNEPGSTFKLATLIALLEDAGASMDETYDTGNGEEYVGRTKIRDTHGYGEITLAKVFEKSSNIGFAKAVYKYYKDSPQKYINALDKLGLSQSMDLQIDGEALPIIRRPGDKMWYSSTPIYMSHGYGLMLTPLKTLTLYNAVANKGRMMRPMFVKELRQYGQTLKQFQPSAIVEKIASDGTLAIVNQAMLDVVEEGTATVVKNKYYKIAAKTGTAQISMGGGYGAGGGMHYLGTLVGYFPADKPKYSIIVVMKTFTGPGNRNPYYGGTIAGPVLGAIADRVYARSTDLQSTVSQQMAKTDEPPYIKLGRSQEVMRVALRFDSKIEAPRKSLWFTELVTHPTKDSVAVEIVDISAVSGSVPSVVGMGLKDALYLLEREGLLVAFEGRGAVTSQSIKAGVKAERGALITLTLGS